MIFFDLDGTLLDFKGAEYRGVLAFYDKYQSSYGLKDNPDAFYDAWCRIGQKHYARFLRGELSFVQQKIERMRELLDPTASEREAAACFQHYVASFESHWQPFDDVFPCLQRLEGQRLGIITNGDLEQQRRKLEAMGLSDRFEVLIASSEAGHAKPDARIFELACARAGIPLHAMVYVGDDVKTDITPCQSMSAKGIWVNRMGEVPMHPVPYAVTSLADLFEHLA